MKYRSRTDIVAIILESASIRPISKTRLMYMSYIPYDQMKSLVPVLIKNDLLIFDKQTHRFHTTPKGLRYLKLYDSMKQCTTTDEFEEQLPSMKRAYTIGKTN
jgi:predicted transcriptional regulator